MSGPNMGTVAVRRTEIEQIMSLLIYAVVTFRRSIVALAGFSVLTSPAPRPTFGSVSIGV